MRKNQKGLIEIILLFVIIFSLVAFGSYFLLKGSNDEVNIDVATKVKEVIRVPSPTPPEAFPFQEMTIPYLKNREYQSDLGELEKVSENGNYTSYFTSYDSDGLQVNGLLTIPNGTQPKGGWPAVVFIHGYIPPSQYQTLVNYNSYVDFLAERGLVVFKIDLRGHDESEGEALGAYYSGDYIVDILNAVDAIKKLKDPANITSQLSIVNPSKIGLWGHSMGGNVVFRSFIASEEVSKVVIWAGAVYTYEDFSQYSISDNSYRPPPQDSPRRRYREELGETYGAFDPTSDFWQQVPATNYLEGKAGEVQVHHALNDAVVEIGYSRNLISILGETNIGHELFEYGSGGHNLIGESFNQAMQRSTDFFKN